jgi:hypothetical protein
MKVLTITEEDNNTNISDTEKRIAEKELALKRLEGYNTSWGNGAYQKDIEKVKEEIAELKGALDVHRALRHAIKIMGEEK